MEKDVAELVEGMEAEEARALILNRRTPVQPKRAPQKAEKEKGKRLPLIKKASMLVAEMKELPTELVHGLLHKGCTMIYGGASKTNKTFGMMDLAVSVAAGIEWWGLKTTKGKVLYIDFELQEAFFTDRLAKIENAKGVTNEVLESIDVWNLRGNAADLSDLIEEIIEHIKESSYDLIILDPIYKVLGNRDENSAGDINSLMNELDKVAVASGAAIVFGHHFSKGNQAGKESSERVSGSGVFARAPDSILSITKHEEENVFTVETTLRNHKSLEPFCVEMVYPLLTRRPDLDPKKLKKANGFQKKYEGTQLMQVLDIDELSTGDWQTKCITRFKMGERTFSKLKKELEADNLIEKTAEGKWKRTRPLDAYEQARARNRKREQEERSAAPVNAAAAERMAA